MNTLTELFSRTGWSSAATFHEMLLVSTSWLIKPPRCGRKADWREGRHRVIFIAIDLARVTRLLLRLNPYCSE